MAFTRVWSGLQAPPQSIANHESQPTLRVLSLNILADVLAEGSDGPAECLSQGLDCPPMFKTYGVGGVAHSAEQPIRAGSVITGAAIDGVQPRRKSESYQFRCSAKSLDWDHRWPLLRSMIIDLQPDIIGLQEVDLGDGERAPRHDWEIRGALAREGYDGACTRKKGRATDGVAVFWRTSRLQRAGNGKIWPLGSGVHVALAQPLVFNGSWPVLAVSTHLKAGLTAEAEAVRKRQVAELLRRLEAHVNAVVMADLNAHCRQTEWCRGLQCATAGGLVQPEAYPLITGERALRSAYREVLNDEPDFTCWGGWANREVRLACDYILFKGEMLQPRSVLQVPTAEDVTRYAERLPNHDFPTDHIPLAADFFVVPPSQSGQLRR